MTKTYIHYGDTKFDIKKFRKIKNLPSFSKPFGGLWASDVNAKFGWKDWNEDSHFVKCTDYNSFKFRLKDSAEVLTVRNKLDVAELPQQGGKAHKYANILGYYPDWEEVLKMGYDAVEVYIDHLYFELYGWDCDSLLVLNPDVVVPVD